MNSEPKLKTCAQGHQFYKSSDCLVCPICEKKNQSNIDFLNLISAPARRALENAHIKTLHDLSKFSEKELLALHGIGKSSIPKFKVFLAEVGLKLKD